MEQRDLLDAQVQAKRMNNLLNEVMDISRQMIEAVDRDDQISVQMLVAMRQEPVSKLQIVDQRMKEQCAALPDPEDGRRLAALLSGGAANAKEEPPTGGADRRQRPPAAAGHRAGPAAEPKAGPGKILLWDITEHKKHRPVATRADVW